MIKLGRLKLAELEDRFSLLSKEEQEALFGAGKTYTFGIDGNIIATSSENPNQANDKVKVGNHNAKDCGGTININTFSVQKETGEKDEKGNPIYETYSGLSITGVNNNVFEYLARHTDVEWGLSSNKDDKNNCLLSTNHDGSTVRLDENVLRPGDDTFFHIHPNGNLDPSDSDMATFYSLLKDTNYNYKRMAIYSPSLYSYSYLKK